MGARSANAQKKKERRTRKGNGARVNVCGCVYLVDEERADGDESEHDKDTAGHDDLRLEDAADALPPDSWIDFAALPSSC